MKKWYVQIPSLVVGLCLSASAFANSTAQSLETHSLEIDFPAGSALYNAGEYLQDKEIILTFDDGPDTETTPQILDILNRYNAKAIFFVLGRRLSENEEAKNILKRTADEGHRIGNHSYTHPGFKGLIKSGQMQTIMNEIAGTHQIIQNTLGFVDPYFRFPGGSHTPELNELLAQYGLTNWRWNIDSLDYEECAQKNSDGRCLRKMTIDENAQAAYQNVIRGLEKHRKGIVLFHDIKPQTVKALPAIMDYIVKNNFKVVLPVSVDQKVKFDNLLKYEKVNYKTH